MARIAFSGRKSAALALGVIGVAGLSFASAATFGGLTVKSLGADTSVVAACDINGITVGFTNTYAAKNYVVSSVNLSGVADTCSGLNAKVTLADASGVSLGEVSVSSLTLTGTSGAKTATLTVPAGVLASAVANVAVVINS